MKKKVLIFVMMMNVLLSVAYGGDEEWVGGLGFKGGASVKSQYIFKGDGYNANPGPVLQPWIEMLHKPSGLYLGVWGSVGLVHPSNEIDGTLGYRTALLDGAVKMDLSFTYARFIEGRWGVMYPQVELCWKALSVCGMVRRLQPDDGFAGSWIVEGSYSPFTWLSTSINYSSGAHGAPQSLVVRLMPSYHFNEHISISVMGQRPIMNAGGLIGSEVVGSVNVSF